MTNDDSVQLSHVQQEARRTTRPRTGHGQASEAKKTCFGWRKLTICVDIAVQYSWACCRSFAGRFLTQLGGKFLGARLAVRGQAESAYLARPPTVALEFCSLGYNNLLVHMQPQVWWRVCGFTRCSGKGAGAVRQPVSFALVDLQGVSARYFAVTKLPPGQACLTEEEEQKLVEC